jgi:hypothetical protein
MQEMVETIFTPPHPDALVVYPTAADNYFALKTE